MNVLLDLNVVLDFLLRRAPWSEDADAIWDAHHEGRINAKLSAAALPTIFYIVRRTAGWDAAHDAIDDCVTALEILAADLRNNSWPNFRDNDPFEEDDGSPNNSLALDASARVRHSGGERSNQRRTAAHPL